VNEQAVRWPALLNEPHHQMNAAAFCAEGVGRPTIYPPREGFAQSSLAYCFGSARALLSQKEEGLKLFAISAEVEA
jgi:hypothetical protein